MNRAKLSVILLFLFGLFLVTTAFADEGVRLTPKSKQHFVAGLAHYDDPSGPKYEDAYREFHAAYAETPSRDIAVNIGTCAFYLERDTEAIEMYELFLAKATAKDITKKKRAQMETDIQSMRAGLVRLSIRTSPAAGTLVDQRFTSKGTTVVNRYPVANGMAAIGIHPGNHKITLEAEGYEPQTWAIDAPPASSHAHEFNLVATAAAKQVVAPATPTPSATNAGSATGVAKDVATTSETNKKRTSPVVYVGAVATGVFAAGAAGMGLVAMSKKSDFNAANDGTQADKAQGLSDDTKRYLLVSDICLGAAVVSAGVTAYFYFTGSSNAPPAASAKASWNLAPAVGTSRAGIAVSGNF